MLVLNHKKKYKVSKHNQKLTHAIHVLCCFFNIQLPCRAIEESKQTSTLTPVANLEFLTFIRILFLDCGRKLELTQGQNSNPAWGWNTQPSLGEASALTSASLSRPTYCTACFVCSSYVHLPSVGTKKSILSWCHCILPSPCCTVAHWYQQNVYVHVEWCSRLKGYFVQKA